MCVLGARLEAGWTVFQTRDEFGCVTECYDGKLRLSVGTEVGVLVVPL